MKIEVDIRYGRPELRVEKLDWNVFLLTIDNLEVRMSLEQAKVLKEHLEQTTDDNN